MDLRPYQQKAIDDIRGHFRAGRKKVLLHLATGGGKTHCFSHMMIEAVTRGKRSIMIVRGRKLVDQASRRLFREGVHHGVLMAGHFNYRPAAPIQICSLDTLHSRKIRPKADLIIIDEAHEMATSQACKEFLSYYPDAFVVPVTATPYVKKGMSRLAEAIVHPVTVLDLINEGYLVPPRYFAPTTPDLTGVAVSRSTGDYKQDQLARAMDKNTDLVGDIIGHWRKISDDRPTLCFAVDIRHSKLIAEQFNNAGIPAEHHDADSTDEARNTAIKRLEAGHIKIITNVGIFCTGVDIPSLGCIIMARPTKSFNLFIQQAGRGTRPVPGKSDFILLDHAGNVLEHGFITDEPPVSLLGYEADEKPKLHTCVLCYAISKIAMNHRVACPACEEFACKNCKRGFKVPITADAPCPECRWRPAPGSEGREIMHADGELSEIKHSLKWKPADLDIFRAEEHCRIKLESAIARGRSPWTAFYSTKENYGADITQLVFFRLCKRLGIDPRKKDNPKADFPFK